MAIEYIIPPRNVVDNFMDHATHDTKEIPTRNFQLKTIVQYLTVSPHIGWATELPSDMLMFFRRTPKHPALGAGYGQVKLGQTRAWPTPKIEIGQFYKNWKPPIFPIYEEAIRHIFQLQTAIYLEAFQYHSQYIDVGIIDKIVTRVPAMNRVAINNTLKDFYSVFWVNFGMTNPVITDSDVLQQLAVANPTSKALTAYTGGIKAKEQNKEIEPAPHLSGIKEYLDIVQKEAKEAIKNITYYDPEYGSLWMNKKDTEVVLKKVAKPNLSKTPKDFVKTLYFKEGDGKTLPNTRAQSLGVLCRLIRRAVLELTDASKPSYRNWVMYDPLTDKGSPSKYKYTDRGITDNRLKKSGEEKPIEDIKFSCYVRPQDLVVCVSAWDYNDLISGQSVSGQAGNEFYSIHLALPEGVTILSMREFRPGQVYIGDKHILNFIMVLDHSEQLRHETYVETTWINNYFLAFGAFQYLGGKMLFPGKNFNAGADFYTWCSQNDLLAA